jgi:hypothetical protein
MTAPDRSAHRTYEERHREIDAETRARFRELADILRIDPGIRPAFIAAGLRAAHFHAADCALAEHELRSGHSWPAEDKQAREELQSRQWNTSLSALRETVPPVAAPAAQEEAPPPGETSRPRRGGYRPISSISRPPGE